MEQLIIASIAFVGTHFLLSHPLRAPVVAQTGERGFMLIYSLVAFAMLGWMATAFRAVPAQAPAWPVGATLWAVGSLLMLLAAILFVGSLMGNPALPGASAAGLAERRPTGVFAITRHPMMWSFALWSLTHFLVSPRPAVHVLTTAILVLALGGAWAQDRKKEALMGAAWQGWKAHTSFVPFGRGFAMPGGVALIGGIVLWLLATWAHMPAMGIAAGIWRWL